MPNPFENYGLLQMLSDANFGTALGQFGQTLDHVAFPDQFARAFYQQYPDVERRRDRNLADMAINYAGGYDWGVRPSIDPQVAREMAKAYQYGDYLTGRKEDSIGDYRENLAGVEAGIAGRNQRMSMPDLVKAAYEFAARQKGLLD